MSAADIAKAIEKGVKSAAETAKTAAKSATETARSVAKSTAGKITLAGAAVGGGSYLALSGVTAGAERVADGISYTLDTTGATDIIGLAVPDFKPASSTEGTKTGNDQNSSSTETGGTSKGIGTILLVAGIVVLAYFVLKKVKTTKKSSYRRA